MSMRGLAIVAALLLALSFFLPAWAQRGPADEVEPWPEGGHRKTLTGDWGGRRSAGFRAAPRRLFTKGSPIFLRWSAR